jgi:GH35 family endo-1,4-beta-xylanase
MRFTFVVMVFISMLSACIHEAAASATTSKIISSQYFGMHIRWGTSTTKWPYIPIYSWRVITDETVWEGLEPRKGEWHFEQLDEAVLKAETHGAEVLLTLGYPPPWAALNPELARRNKGVAQSPQDLADWESYLRKVTMRYKGRIKYYELMNEPLFTETDSTSQDKRYFPVAKMVEMARSAKIIIGQIDSSAKIVSMSPTGGNEGINRLEAFLNAGGGQYIDVVGFHYYVNVAEEIPALVAKTRSVMKRYGLEKIQLWNTEFGFYIDDPQTPSRSFAPEGAMKYSLAEGAAMVSRSIILGVASGLDRNYYYSWDIPTMSLTSNKGELINDAGIAYMTAMRWLRLAALEGCQETNNQLWVCTLSRDGRKARILWNTSSGEAKLNLPDEWHVIGYENIRGIFVDIASDKTINVSGSPVLIRSEKQAWSAP